MSLSTILLEGKKEMLIDKYKNLFKTDDFEKRLSDFIDTDPSVTKKYSEWMILQLRYMLKVNPSERIVDGMNRITDTINTFDKFNTSITKKDIETYKTLIENYKQRGIKLLNDSELNKIENSPKDINSYPNIWALESMNTAIQDRKKREEEHISAKKESEKFYEDDKYLIISPFSHVASCYYGAGTKWCTATRNNDHHFERYMSDGRLIYIIDKKSSSDLFGKMAIFQSKGGNIEVFDQQDGTRSIQFLYERFKDIEDEIREVLGSTNDYNMLKKIKEKRTPLDYGTLSSRFFSKFTDTHVVFDFSGDITNILDLFDMSRDEKWQFDYVMSDGHYDYIFYDGYNVSEDLSEGYIIRNFNDEHLKILKEILSILNPKLSNCIEEKEGNYEITNNCESQIGEFLNELDNEYVNEIKDIYSIAQEQSMLVGVRKAITDEFCEILSDIGFNIIDKNYCFHDYEIKIDTLLDYYEENLEFYKDKTVDEVLKFVVDSKLSLPFSNPYEISYESLDYNEFNEHFDNPITNTLTSFLEGLEEDEEFKDFNEYFKILDEIKKGYKFDRWIKLEGIPGNIEINLERVDPQDNEIIFKVRDNEKNRVKSGSASLRTINTLITNAALFDPFFDDED